ncbi:MAG: transcriptional regulator [Cyanobacteria bacterium J06554_6]
MAVLGMKVRQTKEWDIPDLPERLKAAAAASGKSITQICNEADVSTAFWYQAIKGNKDSITYETLSGLCQAMSVSLKELGVR